MWDEAILWKWSAPLVAAGFGLLLLVVYCAITLVGPIVRPTIITYPWPEHKKENRKTTTTTVVLAGSFNPPHNGHLAMLLYLVDRYVRCCFESSVVGWSKFAEAVIFSHRQT